MARMPLSSPIEPYKSSEKLTLVGLDPIKEMTDFIDHLNEEIERMRYDEDGNERPYSQVAYASLMVTKQAAINNLLKYGYSAIPVKQQVEVTEMPQLSIVMTDDDNFSL